MRYDTRVFCSSSRFHYQYQITITQLHSHTLHPCGSRVKMWTTSSTTSTADTIDSKSLIPIDFISAVWGWKKSELYYNREARKKSSKLRCFVFLIFNLVYSMLNFCQGLYVLVVIFCYSPHIRHFTIIVALFDVKKQQDEKRKSVRTRKRFAGLFRSRGLCLYRICAWKFFMSWHSRETTVAKIVRKSVFVSNIIIPREA